MILQFFQWRIRFMADPEVELADVAAHPTTDQVTAKAHGAIDRAATRVAEAESRVREVASTSADKFGATQQQAKQSVEASLGKLDDFVRSNAVVIAGCAFGVGVIVGLARRRRS
jgi:ElaB/YqjD/DUF883 family membrane-anchored ribosome-binding protein